MQEIVNPWIGVEGYSCFGCDPLNRMGMHMQFYEVDAADRDGDIVSLWQPTQNHQSWINTLHGGVQATLLDEICGWVVFKKLRTSGVTAKMELKYKQAVSTVNGALLLRGRLLQEKHRVAVVEGEIWMPKAGTEWLTKTTLENVDEYFTLCTRAECTYFTFTSDKAKEMGFVEATLREESVTLAQLLEKEKSKRKVQYRPL